MTGLDLTGLERTVNRWLIDDLAVWRDGGVSDDAIDPETMLLIPNDPITVWIGKGAVQPLDTFLARGDADVVRIVEQTGARYRALLPLREATGALVGDVLDVFALHSPSADPRLLGREFHVVELGQPSSFAAVQFLYLRPVGDTATMPAPAPLEP